MIAAHAIKGDRRYRYYVSKAGEDQGERTWRLPAGDLETIVTKGIQALLCDPLRMAAELGDVAATRATFRSACTLLADRISEAAVLRQLGTSVAIHEDRIAIHLDARSVAMAIGADASRIDDEQQIVLSIPAKLKRRGHELRLVYAAADANPARRDDKLIRIISSGYDAYDQLKARSEMNPTRRSHLIRLARLRFLAPDIVAAIVDGRQPVELTTRTLRRISELPLSWIEQRKALGFV